MRYLEDSRLELSNKCVERSMKPFVMGRKNRLLASQYTYRLTIQRYDHSMIETAKETDLGPYCDLLWILRNVPVLSRVDETWAEKLVSTLALQECKIPQK